MFNYNSSVICDKQAKNVLDTYYTILKSIIENPSNTIASIEKLSSRDEKQIMMHNKDMVPDANTLLHRLVEKQFQSQPNASAVISWDGQFTYAELDRLSTRLARYLLTLGVGAEVMVPYLFEKSAWTTVAILGIMKAGGVSVPLDPSHPKNRHQSVASQIKCEVVLVSKQQFTISEGLAKHTVVVSSDFIAQLPDSEEVVPTNLKPSNAVFVIFTSGSTGTPKGVVYEHSGLTTSLIQMGKKFLFDRDTRTLQFAAHVFDVSIVETFVTLIYGGCICVPSDNDRLSNVVDVINQMRINWTFFTPTFARSVNPQDVPGLKTLLLAGEAIGQDNIDKWAPSLRLFTAYGPAECSICCSSSGIRLPQSRPDYIGHSVGSVCWITDAQDPHKLVPTGAVGEILVEGPILGRGYLNDFARTEAAFVNGLKWALSGDSHTNRRFYRTADLGRYNSDGSITIIGRKDRQVKVRGQRVELNEVEYVFAQIDIVRHVVVTYPRSGPYKERLVAVITFRQPTESPEAERIFRFYDRSQKSKTVAAISAIREQLASSLPVYAVPSVWIPVQDLPRTVSGKLDKISVHSRLLSLNNEEVAWITKLSLEDTVAAPVTLAEQLLQEAYSKILNIHSTQIGRESSFLRLGGDSITAIQVMALCRGKGYSVSVPDILRSKTLMEVALQAKPIGELLPSYPDEELDTPFSLSPIQHLHMQREQGGIDILNQNLMLQVNRKISAVTLKNAVDVIVDRHSSLRTQFIQEENGEWKQLIPSSKAKPSYRVDYHQVSDLQEIQSLVHESLLSLDMRKAIRFVAVLLEISTGEQFLFLAAHHLVIDNVSWRILLEDFEDILQNGKLSTTKSLSFQAWVKMQAEYIKTAPQVQLPYSVPEPDYNFWGMNGKPNLEKDAIEETFSLDQGSTSVLLGPDCNNAYRTEPVELLIAAVLFSFHQTFGEREVPPLFNEGHGREPWDSSIDISNTLGWFTTLYPIMVTESSAFKDLEGVLRLVKDVRRKIPHNGWSYFTAHTLGVSDDSGTRHFPAEMAFNYSGIYQQLERDGSLLSNLSDSIPREIRDWSQPSLSAERLTLLNVEVVVERGMLQWSIQFNQNMEHQSRIRSWARTCKSTLEEIVQTLPKRHAEFTLSDFPLLDTDYAGLAALTRGLSSVGDIEDIYPCSPIQTGILLAQAKTPSDYKVQSIFKVNYASKVGAVDANRLCSAWQRVVNRHSMLRTVFSDYVAKDGLIQQIVYRHLEAEIFSLRGQNQKSCLQLLEEYPSLNYGEKRPHHRLLVCRDDQGFLYCMLEINHALMDAVALSVILKDFSLAYDDGQLNKVSAPLYSDYISYIQSQPAGVAINYWTEYLKDITPCEFPTFRKILELEGAKDSIKTKVLLVQVPFAQSSSLHEFCRQNELTPANFFQAVWALVLMMYTTEKSACFGSLASGRDLPLRGINEAVGPYINMLICRAQMKGSETTLDFLQRIHHDNVNSMNYQLASLGQIHRALGLSDSPLFNTIMSLQHASHSTATHSASIKFDEIHSEDPTEVSCHSV